jgi:hypothetical protein
VTRRRAFAASVALAIAGHACLAVLAAAAPGVEPRPSHAHTVWLSGAPASMAPGQPEPAAMPVAAPRPVAIAVAAAEIADALPARQVAEAVTRAREALAEPAIADARDAIAPDRLAAYRPPSELTRRAQVASPVDLSFRPASSSGARGGSARFIVLVSALGTVDGVVVERSSLPDEIRALAVAGFQQARFSPGMVDSEPVPARVTIEVSDAAGLGT